jgi:hypothetical protein
MQIITICSLKDWKNNPADSVLHKSDPIEYCKKRLLIKMKALHRILFGFHLLVGVGAMAGGFAAIANPQSPLGAPTDMLKNSPFSDFLIPGILLFGVIGVGNVVSAVLVQRNPWYFPYVSSVFGGALVIWIIVQCIMICDIVFLHILFFAIGVIQASIGIFFLFQSRMFPFYLLAHYWEKLVVKEKA